METGSFLLILPPGCSSWKVETLKTSLSMTIHISSGWLCDATSLRVNVLGMVACRIEGSSLIWLEKVLVCVIYEACGWYKYKYIEK
jgi:hypothetical protein